MSHMPLWLAPSSPVTPARSSTNVTPQLVQGDVHQHLVEGPVEERGVDRDDRVQAADRQAGGRGGGVLLGDADVEGALGEAGLEVVQPDRVHHRGGDRRRRRWRRWPMCTISSAKTSVQIRPLGISSPVSMSNGPGPWNWSASCALGGVVAEALAGQRVHDHRAAEPLGLGERLLHRGAVVAVDGADVLEAEVLEEALRRDARP